MHCNPLSCRAQFFTLLTQLATWFFFLSSFIEYGASYLESHIEINIIHVQKRIFLFFHFEGFFWVISILRDMTDFMKVETIIWSCMQPNFRVQFNVLKSAKLRMIDFKRWKSNFTRIERNGFHPDWLQVSIPIDRLSLRLAASWLFGQCFHENKKKILQFHF